MYRMEMPIRFSVDELGKVSWQGKAGYESLDSKLKDVTFSDYVNLTYVFVVNNYYKEKELRISKNFNGNDYDPTDECEVEITLSNLPADFGNIVKGYYCYGWNYDYSTSPTTITPINQSAMKEFRLNDGKVTAMLNGEDQKYVCLTNLPDGTRYSIVEKSINGTPAADSRYSVSYSNNYSTLDYRRGSSAYINEYVYNTANTFQDLTIEKIRDGNIDPDQEYEFTIYFLEGRRETKYDPDTGQIVHTDTRQDIIDELSSPGQGGVPFNNLPISSWRDNYDLMLKFFYADWVDYNAVPGLLSREEYNACRDQYWLFEEAAYGYFNNVIDLAHGAGTVTMDVDSLRALYDQFRNTLRSYSAGMTSDEYIAMIAPEYDALIDTLDNAGLSVSNLIGASPYLRTKAGSDVHYYNGRYDCFEGDVDWYTDAGNTQYRCGRFKLRGGQSLTIKNIPLNFVYYVVEDDYSAQGIVTEYDNNLGTFLRGQDQTAKITNSGMSYMVEKVWEDGFGGPREHPEIQVQLYADRKPEGDPVTLSDTNGWSYEWKNIKLAHPDGRKIVYSAWEIKGPNGWTATHEPVHSQLTRITNTWMEKSDFVIKKIDGEDGKPLAGAVFGIYGKPLLTYNTPKRNISVSALWDDQNDRDHIRNKQLVVHLYGDGVDTGRTITLTEDGSWIGRFEDVDMYSSGNTEIEYTITADVNSGYNVHIHGDAALGFDITSKHDPIQFNIPVSVTWDDDNDRDGRRPASVTIRLTLNGTELDSRVLSEANNWTGSFEGLYKYAADGSYNAYYVTEDSISQYSINTTYGGANGYVFRNYHSKATRTLYVYTVWTDNNDADHLRPGAVTITFFADGQEVGTAKSTKRWNETQWNSTYDYAYYSGDRYNNKVEVDYTISAPKVTGYKDPRISYNSYNEYSSGSQYRNIYVYYDIDS